MKERTLMRSADYAWLRSGLEEVEDALSLEADLNWRARGMLDTLRRILDHIAAEQARAEQREQNGSMGTMNEPPDLEPVAVMLTAYTRLANAVLRRWRFVRYNQPFTALDNSGEETLAVFHSLMKTQISYLVCRNRVRFQRRMSSGSWVTRRL